MPNSHFIYFRDFIYLDIILHLGRKCAELLFDGPFSVSASLLEFIRARFWVHYRGPVIRTSLYKAVVSYPENDDSNFKGTL